MQEYNYRHVQTTCPECHNSDILTDPEHLETYCTQCGLILTDNYSLSKITVLIEKENRNTKTLKRIYNEEIYNGD